MVRDEDRLLEHLLGVDHEVCDRVNGLHRNHDGCRIRKRTARAGGIGVVTPDRVRAHDDRQDVVEQGCVIPRSRGPPRVQDSRAELYSEVRNPFQLPMLS